MKAVAMRAVAGSLTAGGSLRPPANEGSRPKLSLLHQKEAAMKRCLGFERRYPLERFRKSALELMLAERPDLPQQVKAPPGGMLWVAGAPFCSK